MRVLAGSVLGFGLRNTSSSSRFAEIPTCRLFFLGTSLLLPLSLSSCKRVIVFSFRISLFSFALFCWSASSLSRISSSSRRLCSNFSWRRWDLQWFSHSILCKAKQFSTIQLGDEIHQGSSYEIFGTFLRATIPEVKIMLVNTDILKDK